MDVNEECAAVRRRWTRGEDERNRVNARVIEARAHEGDRDKKMQMH